MDLMRENRQIYSRHHRNEDLEALNVHSQRLSNALKKFKDWQWAARIGELDHRNQTAWRMQKAVRRVRDSCPPSTVPV